MPGDQLILLQRKLEDHIELCEEKFQHGEDRFDELISCTMANTKAVTALTEELDPIVKLQHDLQAAASLGIRVQKFGLWLAKWPVIGVGLYAIYHWAVELIAK